ncbi:MAG: hypothetical protein HKO89_08365, partial [Saprospiraceae bacterium]|nr:hypothetical protein [Saprospiraceae bacterium]
MFLLSIYFLGYYVSQDQFYFILSAYTIAFAIYILFLLQGSKHDYHWLPFLVLAMLARGMLFFSFPALSDDVYRFIWDGEMIHHGIHPLSYTPEYVLSNIIQDNEYLNILYELMNSQVYYTVYPPVHQLCFYLAAFGDHNSPEQSAMVLRV